MQSVYRWEGQLFREREWRLAVKFLESKSAALETLMETEHPYDTPEWVVVRPEQVMPNIWHGRKSEISPAGVVLALTARPAVPI